LIVGQAIGTLLRLAPTARNDHRDGFQPQLCRYGKTQLAGQQVTFLVDQHRRRPPPCADGGGKLFEVGFAMKPGIVGIGDQPLDRPTLDPIGWPRTCRSRTR